eukprot:CAMPEP_0197246562 /NCGR_PEP_ID=MMETSP1429-20130617/15660_1 /TAXON_ID=49237 /ORGANISM="Chaetoceros  sp., Strain UNC1202" /LENGTH=270 /DNA_ID=CAMNT_0042707251 /DNA_START=27 /DNA_END=839 /DNA_ORIENTATION=+
MHPSSEIGDNIPDPDDMEMSQEPSVFENLNLSEPQRFTSQDWPRLGDRSTSQVDCLPQGFSFNDNFAEEDPQTSALLAHQSLGNQSSSNRSLPVMNRSDMRNTGQTSSVRDFPFQFPSSSLSDSTRSLPTASSTGFPSMPQLPQHSSFRSVHEIEVIQNPTGVDVLLGRGGQTNNHPGNVKYREQVERTKAFYQDCTTKEEKKRVSQLLVDYVHDYGGRFLVKSREADGWVLADPSVARKKASQALRENKARRRSNAAAAAYNKTVRGDD